MSRARHFREIRVKLECGHMGRLNTSRYRVSADLCAMIVGHAARKGVWCQECGAACQPKKLLGVFRATDSTNDQ